VIGLVTFTERLSDEKHGVVVRPAEVTGGDAPRESTSPEQSNQRPG